MIDQGGFEITVFAPSSSEITVFELGGIDRGGFEITVFAPSSSEITVFELGGIDQCGFEITVFAPSSSEISGFDPGTNTSSILTRNSKQQAHSENIRVDYYY